MMQENVPDSLPFSEACERNKAHILAVLTAQLPPSGEILEVGSGTGQHVVCFAQTLADWNWQPTDTGDYLPGLCARVRSEASPNVRDVVELNVSMSEWPVGKFDAIYSANTLHFISFDCVRAFFVGAAKALHNGGTLVVYGPFRYNGAFTAESNAQFDQWLKSGDPLRGVRDFEWVNELAADQGMQFVADIAMPSNNQCLVWHRSVE